MYIYSGYTIYNTRLLWRFAPIFHFYCEHKHVYIVKQKQTKTFADFIKENFEDFKNSQKWNFDGGKFLKIPSSINLTWGHARSLKKLGPIGSAVLTFIGYKRTDRQTSKVHRY